MQCLIAEKNLLGSKLDYLKNEIELSKVFIVLPPKNATFVLYDVQKEHWTVDTLLPYTGPQKPPTKRQRDHASRNRHAAKQDGKMFQVKEWAGLSDG